MPLDSINYPLESSITATLEHPIHMPSFSALSYRMYSYESPMQGFFWEIYYKNNFIFEKRGQVRGIAREISQFQYYS